MASPAQAPCLGVLISAMHAVNVGHGPEATRRVLSAALASLRPTPPTTAPAGALPTYRGRWADIEEDDE